MGTRYKDAGGGDLEGGGNGGTGGSNGGSDGGLGGIHPEIMMRGSGGDVTAEDETNAGAIGAGVAPPPGVSCVDEKREACETWACGGECETNAGFMQQSCPCACAAVTGQSTAAAAVAVAVAAVAATDVSGGVALGMSWTSPGGAHRTVRVRITLDAADAPKAVAAVHAAVREGTCAAGAVCGGGCHFHRVEPGYGLVQGNLAGIGKAGGAFGKRTEGTATW